ncbi:hypothetical protein DMENIID0001_015330 [Sergentomyia squamirostris]
MVNPTSNSRKRSRDELSDTASISPASSRSSGYASLESAPTIKKQRVVVSTNFKDGVPGVKLVRDEKKVQYLREKCRKMCDYKYDGFPGTQPAALGRGHLVSFHIRPYRVSWKAAGTRYMMLILGKDQVYMFDRENNCYQVEGLRFPLRTNFSEHLTNTLVDGVMVLDIVDGVGVLRYLIFDIIYCNGVDVKGRDFHPDRMGFIENEIVRVRTEATNSGFLQKNLEPFSIRVKPFWNATETEFLLQQKFLKTLSHGFDGLIFQPKFEPYRAGNYSYVLRWKPFSEDTVDLYVNMNHQQNGTSRGLLVDRKHNVSFDKNRKCPYYGAIEFAKKHGYLNNRIIECRFEHPLWVFVRERKDKSIPDNDKFVESVKDSNKYHVRPLEIVDFIKKNNFRAEYD